MKWRILGPLAVVLVVCGALSAWLYSQDDTSGSRENIETAGPGLAEGDVELYAVPSIEPLMDSLKSAFEAENPDATATVKVAPVEETVVTVTSGLGAGLFFAPENTVARVQALNKTLGDSETLGRNLFVIAVPTGNPSGVKGLEAFDKESGLRTAACASRSAYGNFAEIVLKNAGVEPDPETVKTGCAPAAMAELAAGTLDAALVQRTFVSDDVGFLPIDDAVNVIAGFEVLPLGDDSTSADFLAFLESETGQAVLTREGFLP